MLTKLILKGHPKVADAVVDFQKGFNLLTAPNGRGKSTILETVAYCLFGTAALRGTLEEFPKLEAQLLFKVQGKSFRVLRSKKETTLFEGDEPIASGTTAVNAALARILGYNMKVYNVANHIRQGQVNALTDRLRPEDRRQVLENTVGLTVIDKVISELNKDYLSAQADLKANTLLHVEPTCPEMPKGFLEPIERAAILESLKDTVRSYRDAKAKLVKITPPMLPEGEPLSLDELAELQAMVKQWVVLRAEVTQKIKQRELITEEIALMNLTKPTLAYNVKHSRETLLSMVELDNKINLLQNERSLRAKPRLTREEINAERYQAKVYKLVTRFIELNQHLATCPKCNHEFVPNTSADAEMRKIEAELTTLLDEKTALWLTTGVREATKPNYSEASLIAEEMLLPNLDRITEIEAELAQLDKIFIADYKLQLENLDKYERVLTKYEANVARLAVLQKQIAELGDLEFDHNMCAALERKLKHQESLIAAQAAYQSNLAHYEAQAVKNSRLEHNIALLEGCEEDLLKAEAVVKLSEKYDYELATYQVEVSQFNKRTKRIEDLVATVADLQLAINGLKETKKRIKSFLLPSLNKAASALATMMTQGVIRHIEMLDDFSVKAEGKRVELFSGSEQAIINIALRVALGQVLTHKSFSVIIGDELDASMDTERTGLLWKSLNLLIENGGIEQLILVSHAEEPIEVPKLTRVLFT
jgi:exonuclease SbcC